MLRFLLPKFHIVLYPYCVWVFFFPKKVSLLFWGMAVFSRVTSLALVQINIVKDQNIAFRVFLSDYSRDTVPGIATKL